MWAVVAIMLFDWLFVMAALLYLVAQIGRHAR